ncbi:hypothetical protein [Allomuricauda sp. F6463D]|uniref:hypothetical protein n=1 Tax=Allomuricauda sp. F6463D TaxID=2926409 RepID=UPI001FF55D3A|nr:hypothetical protein [Muricauda sp. F6463D]MCK0160641.1 hypothetical protein [Muricauda sp. F6463D]
MKIINKSLSVAALALLGLTFNSCDDGDTVIDEVFANTTSGIVLRTVNVESDELPIGQSDSYFAVELEMQDEEDGALVESLDVFVSFSDRTVEEGETDYSASEVQVATISSSEFTTGQYGFPRTTYSITLPEMLSALSLSETNVDGGDNFSIRFAANMTDGRTFSNGQNTDTSTGSFFASPFQYNAAVVCPPTTPTAGEWTIDMQDAYGDGWNGASVAITIDGEETSYTIDDGASVSATFDVPDGTEVISIKFVSGDWDSEVTFQVTSANGDTILDLGPSPTAEVELLNYCLDNL